MSSAAVAMGELAAAVDGHLVRADELHHTVADLTHDSRQVQPGFVFACVVGEAADGHDFAQAAAAAGAGGLLVERELDVDLPQLLVADVRAALAPAASLVHGHPSRRLATVGVTGTAGKTTVTHAVADILNHCGRRCAVLGTLDGPRTTPEAPDLQRWLAQRLADGAECAAIEVSSHALDLGRVDDIDFAVGAFTNLGAEHLDFHDDMESYFAAKRRLFDGRSRQAVINLDDEYGSRLFNELAGSSMPVHGYRLSDATAPRLDAAGASFGWRGHPVKSRLVGAFNVSNLLGAAGIATALGVDDAQVAAALGHIAPVRGRMEPVPVRGADITVVVDYSHKPDALRAALASAREFTRGRLWVVFGAGGDRDRQKRPLMGEAAAEIADVAVVTSDNPRSEDPLAIIDEIVASMSEPIVEPDRAAAIRAAVRDAAPGDVVVIAGKGHETTQTIGDRVVDFDDAAVAGAALQHRVAARGTSE